jgi:hypothetical protein
MKEEPDFYLVNFNTFILGLLWLKVLNFVKVGPAGLPRELYVFL